MGIDSAGNLFSSSYLFEDRQDRLIQVGPGVEIGAYVAVYEAPCGADRD